MQAVLPFHGRPCHAADAGQAVKETSVAEQNSPIFAHRQSSRSISKLVRGVSGISPRAGDQDDVLKPAPLPSSILIEGFTIPSVRYIAGLSFQS